jgi:hypothetical protein
VCNTCHYTIYTGTENTLLRFDNLLLYQLRIPGKGFVLHLNQKYTGEKHCVLHHAGWLNDWFNIVTCLLNECLGSTFLDNLCHEHRLLRKYKALLVRYLCLHLKRDYYPVNLPFAYLAL